MRLRYSLYLPGSERVSAFDSATWPDLYMESSAASKRKLCMREDVLNSNSPETHAQSKRNLLTACDASAGWIASSESVHNIS
jgi:hypothetical protein